MYSKLQTDNLEGNSLNPNHWWIGGDPIYCTSEEKTVTLALTQDSLVDQSEGMGVIFTYHFPLPLRTSLGFLPWMKTNPGRKSHMSLVNLQQYWPSHSLNAQISWLHPQLVSKHFCSVMTEPGATSVPSAKNFAILLAQRFRPRLTKVIWIGQWALFWLKAFSRDIKEWSTSVFNQSEFCCCYGD